MAESTTRRRAVLIGLLVGLPVILLGGAARRPGTWPTSTCPGRHRMVERAHATVRRSPEALGRDQRDHPEAAPARRLVADQPPVHEQRARKPSPSVTSGSPSSASTPRRPTPSTRAPGGLPGPADAGTTCSCSRVRVHRSRSPRRSVVAVAAPQDAQPAGEPGRLQGRHVSRSATSATRERGQDESRGDARRARSDPARPAGLARPPGSRFGGGVLGRVGRRIGLRGHRHHAGGDAEPGHPYRRTLSRGSGVGGPDGHQPEPRPASGSAPSPSTPARAPAGSPSTAGTRDAPWPPSPSPPRPTRAPAGPWPAAGTCRSLSPTRSR